MLRTPHALLEGILIVMNVLRLTRAYIYIRGEYLTESEVLEAAIARGAGGAATSARAGPDGYVPEITVHRGAGAYICGEETALLASLNGFRGQPSAKPPFPAVSGAFERPTLLNNVETIATIPAILRRGRRGLQGARHRAERRHARACRSPATSCGRATTRCP